MDDDTEALKIHGYTFSDSDSESSSEDEANDSTIVSNRKHTGAGSKPKPLYLTDSGQSSGLSDFDDDYYAVQPPAVPIKEFNDRIVKIRVTNVWDRRMKTRRCHTRLSNESESENETNAKPSCEDHNRTEKKQIPKAPLKSVWNTTNDFNFHPKAEQTINKERRTRSRSSTSSSDSAQGFLLLPEVTERIDTSNYLEEFPPLPQPKGNGRFRTTRGNRESFSVNDATENLNCSNYLHTTERCHSEVKISNSPPEFTTLPQLNKSRRVSANTSSPSAVKQDSCLPEFLKGFNSFNYPQEFPSHFQPNQSRRLSNASTSSGDTTENISLDTITVLSIDTFKTHRNMVNNTNTAIEASASNNDYFLTLLEDADNKNIDNESISSSNYGPKECLFLEAPKHIITSSLSVSDIKSEKLDNTSATPTCLTREFMIPPTCAENLKIKTTSILCSSEQIFISPTQDKCNISSCSTTQFSEPATNSKQENVSHQANYGFHAANSTSKTKKPNEKKSKLEINEKSSLSELTKVNINNSTSGFIIPNFQKFATEEIKIETPAPAKIKPTRFKRIPEVQTAEFKELGTTTTENPKTTTANSKIHLGVNQKFQAKTTLNENHKMGPRNTIHNCCDTKDVVNHNKVPDFFKNKLVRTNNATRTRIRLAGERRRKRFSAQLNQISDDDLAKSTFAKAIILLFLISYGFYNVMSFLNLYIRSIFEICEDG